MKKYQFQYSQRKKFKKPYAPPGNVSPYEYSVWFLSTFNGRTLRVRPDESPRSYLRRFEKIVEISGIMREMKKREFYLTPSQRKKEKKKRSAKKLRKRLRGDDAAPELLHLECKPGICYAPKDKHGNLRTNECQAFYAFSGGLAVNRGRNGFEPTN